jgi:hypothetical protein
MSFDVGVLHPNQPHLFADLAELLLITNNLGKATLGRADLADLFNDTVISLEEIDAEASETAMSGGKSSAEITDRQAQQIDDVFSQLEYRALAIGDAYPFALQNELLTLNATLTDTQKIYTLLLVCSRLRSFISSRGAAQMRASDFARTSREAMRGLLPSFASVDVFDANSEDRRNIYGTNLREAVKVLARKLSIRLIEDQVASLSTSGDRGIDLVGVVDFADNALGNYAVFGQCGAQEVDWPSKKLEAHPINQRDLFHIQADYPSIIFTPVFFRNSNGNWIDNRELNGVFLVDRLRILKLILKIQNQPHVVATQWFRNFETWLNEIRDQRTI